MSVPARHVHERPERYEARAVWIVGAHYESQPLSQYDIQRLHPVAPTMFGVYAVGGGVVEDHKERATAETHAAQLNGVQS